MKKYAIYLASLFLCLVACGTKEEYRSVNVGSLDGDVTLVRENADAEIYEGMNLIPLDEVKTGDESKALLHVDADKHILVNDNTVLNINAVGNSECGKVTVFLAKGEAEFTIDNKLPEKDEFEVVTSNATMSVRGTKFVVNYNSETNETIVIVNEGTVAVKAGNNERNVTANETVIISKDETIEDYSEITYYYLTELKSKIFDSNGELITAYNYEFSYSQDGELNNSHYTFSGYGNEGEVNNELFYNTENELCIVGNESFIYENLASYLFACKYHRTISGGGTWYYKIDDSYQEYTFNDYGINIYSNYISYYVTNTEETVEIDEYGNCTYYKGSLKFSTGDLDDGIEEYYTDYEYEGNGKLIRSIRKRYVDGEIKETTECEYTYATGKDIGL